MTYTREERPWLSAQAHEFLTFEQGLKAPAQGDNFYVLLVHWIEKREVIFGHEFLRNEITRTECLLGFGNKKAVVARSKEDANALMVYLTDLFCYAPPELLDTYDAEDHAGRAAI